MTDSGSDYFLEIESYFAQRRGTPFILSAKDYALMQKWHEEGIPLAVVLEAIGSCFEKRTESPRRRTISSLSYCRHAVVDLWNERRDLSVGADRSVPESDPGRGLDAIADQLVAAAETSSDQVRAMLMEEADACRVLAKGRSVPEIEEALIERESTFLARLTASLPQKEREKLERDVEKAIANAGKLEPHVLAKTRDANRRRILRKRFGLPRFSLFG